MMHQDQQENQRTYLCEFDHQVYPVTPTGQPNHQKPHSSKQTLHGHYNTWLILELYYTKHGL